MFNRRRDARAVVVAMVLVLSAALPLTAAAAPDTAGEAIPRTADGHPDLNGMWQVLGSAHWNIEGHAAAKTPATATLGSLGAIAPGVSVVEGGAIPYKPEALAKRDANRANWLKDDSAVKCFIPGIPRSTYMPMPFQIVQSATKVFIAYEWGSNSRTIHLDRPGTEAELPSWMGYSLARWEGDTLVVDVSSQMAESWFDSSGNYHSENVRVTERYTPMGRNHIDYEATIEDPEVFTKPWKIRMPLYRRLDAGARILEFKCVEFGEDAMYGHLRRGATAPPAPAVE